MTVLVKGLTCSKGHGLSKYSKAKMRAWWVKGKEAYACPDCSKEVFRARAAKRAENIAKYGTINPPEDTGK